MSRCGDVYKNRVTEERAVILRGTEDSGQGSGIVHLVARPGAAVVGEHFSHPLPAIQRVALEPLGRLLGYRAIIPAYCKPRAHVTPASDVLAGAAPAR